MPSSRGKRGRYRQKRRGTGRRRGQDASSSRTIDSERANTTRRSSTPSSYPSSQLFGLDAASPFDSPSPLRRRHPPTEQSDQQHHASSDVILKPDFDRDSQLIHQRTAGTEDERSIFEAAHREDIIMAVDMKENGCLGCAYFSASEQGLYLLHDMESADAGILESLLAHVQPTTVLLPLKAPEAVVALFERHTDLWDEGSAYQSYLLRMLVSAEFNQDFALERLMNLVLHSKSHPQAVVQPGGATGMQDSRDTSPECPGPAVIGQYRLGSLIQLESHLSIGCAGAILSELSRRCDPDKNPSRSMTCRSLQTFALADFLLVNMDTLTSLQILRSELHPNSQARSTGKANTGAKESLSVYGLFASLTGTQQGKAKLRQMILRPTVNLTLINERHQLISELLQPAHTEMLKSICRTLRKVPDMRRTIRQLKRGIESGSGRIALDKGVWWSLNCFALGSLQLREALKQLSPTSETGVVDKVINSISPVTMKQLGEMIGEIIDFGGAKIGGRVAVRWGINEELDRLKRDYNGMEALLGDVSSKLSEELPEWAREIVTSCIFWPQLGFLTIVPLCPGTEKPMYEGEGLQDDDWARMFLADEKAYYKNRRMRELDAHLGDIYGSIVGGSVHLKTRVTADGGPDLEIEVLHKLAIRILAYESVLFTTSDECGELDALVAMALAAEKYCWKAPEMTTSNVTSIHNGRHPLQELAVPLFIPNDCYLRGGDGHDGPELDPSTSSPQTTPTPISARTSMTLLTGPNHSGKSVYLKQIALITYLAHVGSFVPADMAVVGLTDRILTRMTARESISRNGSAFTVDLQQVAFCLKSFSHRSLVLIDEFGKGTTTEDGAGLLAALVTHYLTIGVQTPRLLVATHFHEIFDGHYLEDFPSLALAYMNVHLDPKTDQEGDQLTFLYRLEPGRSASSFGGYCAALNSVDEAVVDRANEISLLLSRNEDLSAGCTQLDSEDYHRIEEAEAAARRFLSIAPSDLLAGIIGDDEHVRYALGKVLEDTSSHA